MRVLVTGAAGFIGSHLAEALCRGGHDVTGVDDFDPYYSRDIKERNLRVLRTMRSFRFVEADLREAGAVARLFAEPYDRVAHLAGRGGVRTSIGEPAAYMERNYLATLNILERMKETPESGMVFASTSSVYGNLSEVPFREDGRADWPISPYSASKKACEVLCYTYHHLYGMPVYALRFFTVYGPRQRPDMAIHKFVKALYEGRPIERYGDGATRRDYTYVDDIVRGVVRGVERVEGYEIINIGGSRTTDLSALLELLQRITGIRAAILQKPLPPGDVLQTYADVEKAGRLLDFRPAVALEEGLRHFHEWYRQEFVP